MIETRKIEEKMLRLFSEKKPFSEHLFKWEDSLLPDKYDHNYFEYFAQPSKEEFQLALQYQKNLDAKFIKLVGYNSLDDCFGLVTGTIATMLLNNKEKSWKTNNYLTYKKPSLFELKELEVKHYGTLYGEDFSRRNIKRLFDVLEFHGAYLNEQLVGACYSYTSDGLTCIDGLLVDDKHRKQYVATSLIANIKNAYPNTTLFLHAEVDDTPIKMYLKMGFEIVDKMYEYFCEEIAD